MKIWVIYKIRKDMDLYQSHSWRLVSAGDDEQSVDTEMQSLIKRLSNSELRAGWTYEKAPVEANIHVAAKV